MTKKKQIDPDKEEAVEIAVSITGDEMRKCSEEIYAVISKYYFTPAMIYGILDAVKFNIMVDVYPFKFETDTNEISQESIEKIEEEVKQTIKEKEKKANQESEVMFS